MLCGISWCHAGFITQDSGDLTEAFSAQGPLGRGDVTGLHWEVWFPGSFGGSDALHAQ